MIIRSHLSCAVFKYDAEIDFWGEFDSIKIPRLKKFYILFFPQSVLL
jgi:hypothetical protein